MVLLILNLTDLLGSAAIQIRYPFEFDYGEGIVWQQMRNIVAGQGYAPLGVYPAIVYHYPPVYHLTVASISTLFGVDQLAAGRAVSVLCTLALAALVGLLSTDLVGKDATRRVRFACGAVAGLLLLSVEPVVAWSPLMRVDMLCYMLTFVGLVFALRSVERPLFAAYAGVAFTLAVFTKQTAIAAPTAAMIMLLVVAPRQAKVLLTTCLAVGLPILGWLLWSTDGNFATHIFRYNVNRFSLEQATGLFAELQLHLFLILAGIVSGSQMIKKLRSLSSDSHTGSWRYTVRNDRSARASILMLAYLILTTLMVPLILKSGASQNYLIEWFCALALLAGAAFQPLAALIFEKERAPLPSFVAILFALGMPIQVYSVASIQVNDLAAVTRSMDAAIAPIVRLIARSQKPVISDDMTLLIRAGKPVEWESAITAELGHDGIYNERAFATLVRNEHFGFFITRGQRGDWLFDSRYNPIVAEAMNRAYPRKVAYAGYILHFPPLVAGFTARPSAPAAAALAR
jgi:4-amino-4-deoxy-L-arabinose transferase-like glycosyltransferase